MSISSSFFGSVSPVLLPSYLPGITKSTPYGLSPDVLVDPAQLDLELLGREADRAEHAEAARLRHRDHHVAAVGEREDRELDVEPVAEVGVHGVLQGWGQVTDAPRGVSGGDPLSSKTEGQTMGFLSRKTEMPTRGHRAARARAGDAGGGQALRARQPDRAAVPRTACSSPLFGMGCFWGAEKKFWQAPGVYTTAVGYAGGFTPNPTYEEVCSGRTGHNEVVRVVFDPAVTSYRRDAADLLGEPRPDAGHAPGQRRRHAVPLGASTSHGDAQRAAAIASRDAYAARLAQAGYGAITTEIVDAPEFYYAEDYHQQYLAKNPHGYCGIGGTGVSCPIGVDA